MVDIMHTIFYRHFHQHVRSYVTFIFLVDDTKIHKEINPISTREHT